MANKKSEERLPIVFEEEYTAGRPKSFANEEDFQSKILQYFSLCDKHIRMPNRSGFCAFANVTRETYYKQKEYYPSTFDIVEGLFEDGFLNTPVNPGLALAALAKQFGYSKEGTANSDTSIMDINFDATKDEIDLMMLKLGYTPIEAIGEEPK
jgi:hypothetical protein